MQMDLRSHRILLASIVELRELQAEYAKQGYPEVVARWNKTLDERLSRYDSGEFYTDPGDSGVGEDSGGSV